MKFKGTGVSAGIGIGRAVVVREVQAQIEKRSITRIEEELALFQKSLDATKEETRRMVEDLEKNAGAKEAEILQGHILLLQDPMLVQEIEGRIRGDSLCAEYVITDVCDQYAAVFASMDDELMQQRAADMRDLKGRLVKKILGLEAVDVGALPKGSILVAEDLTPSMTAGLNPANVWGIVTELGGRTSHSAILARALEIPAVVSCSGIMDAAKDGEEIVLDGERGEVIAAPGASERKVYEEARAVFEKNRRELSVFKTLPTRSKDGKAFETAANIGRPADIDKAVENGAEGVGLFRTEFLFMDRDAMPDEEEQFESYKKVAMAMGERPVIVRTLDIGGDKEIPYMGIDKDENPFLGYRAIRLCLDRKEDIYKPQLRAILRASVFGNLRIMVPMVTCLEEIREAKALILEVQRELEEKQIPFQKDIPIGIMTETAASSLMADQFAKEVDFFSIGTNDLIQYTMSVDRGNAKVSYLYSPYNPAVLRSIYQIISAAKKAGIYVGMCGEAAADPLLTPVLMAWGLDEFSMSASSILETRKRIAGLSLEELKTKADRVLDLATEQEVRSYLEELQK